MHAQDVHMLGSIAFSKACTWPPGNVQVHHAEHRKETISMSYFHGRWAREGIGAGPVGKGCVHGDHMQRQGKRLCHRAILLNTFVDSASEEGVTGARTGRKASGRGQLAEVVCMANTCSRRQVPAGTL